VHGVRHIVEFPEAFHHKEEAKAEEQGRSGPAGPEETSQGQQAKREADGEAVAKHG
jgi:hypothetical protein